MNEEKKISQEECYSRFDNMPCDEMMSQMMEGKWEGWWAMDRLDAIGWAGVFIWGALVLLADITNYAENFSWWDGWGAFLVGVAAILLAGTTFRWFVPEFRRPGLVFGFVFGLILLGIGLGDLAVWIWPALLCGIGITILYRVLISGR